MPVTESFKQAQPPLRRASYFALIAAAHVGLVWLLVDLARRPAVHQAAQALLVRLIAPVPPAPPAPPAPPEARPPPKRQAPRKPPPPAVAPMPEVPVVLATVPMPLSVAAPVSVPMPVAISPPAAAPPPPPAPVAVIAARVDAGYLANPKPVYPMGSRRLGEEGTVTLRVKVSAGGTPARVEIGRSSGFARLDEAARTAVEQWRFLPARRGDEPIEAWVSVPIVFSLQAS